MSDCGCDKAKAELEEYLHNELQKDAASDIQAHLEHCTDCRTEHLVGRTLTEAVQRACKEVVPEDLRDQVLLRLRALQSEH